MHLSLVLKLSQSKDFGCGSYIKVAERNMSMATKLEKCTTYSAEQKQLIDSG